MKNFDFPRIFIILVASFIISLPTTAISNSKDMLSIKVMPLTPYQPPTPSTKWVGISAFDYVCSLNNKFPFLQILEPLKKSKDYESASAMRDIALAYGRGTIEYTILLRDADGGPKFPYLFATQFDAVSNMLYNISYIFSIPSKFVYAFKANVAPTWYIVGPLYIAFSAAWGVLGVAIMIIPSIFIGFLCHPINSLLNLSIYIFASLYDLFWGAILAPLLDTFLLMF